MSIHFNHRDSCRLCGSIKLKLVVNLQPIPLSEGYTLDAETALLAERFPVDVYMCQDCGHVQQLDVIDPHSLWDNYTYASGDAKGMPEHFHGVCLKILDRANPEVHSLVVDIGSNDGSLLKFFQATGHRVLGIDPAIDVARRANKAGIPTIASLMTPEVALTIRKDHGPASVVAAFNVFAHADDLSAMADSVRIMLAPNGLFFFEAQYLLDIIDGVLIATIFHEHISHHSVKPLVGFFDRHGLELIDVDRAKIQHGSIIGTVQLKGSGRPVENSVREIIGLEEERHLDSVETMENFARCVDALREHTVSLVSRWKADGHIVAAFGAARSGPTLIAQLGLQGLIDFIVDDHPEKVGKFSSGDGIPILPISALAEKKPTYTIILAWVHSQNIIDTYQEYLKDGGHFVVLCPNTRVVGSIECDSESRSPLSD